LSIARLLVMTHNARPVVALAAIAKWHGRLMGKKQFGKMPSVRSVMTPFPYFVDGDRAALARYLTQRPSQPPNSGHSRQFLTETAGGSVPATHSVSTREKLFVLAHQTTRNFARGMSQKPASFNALYHPRRKKIAVNVIVPSFMGLSPFFEDKVSSELRETTRNIYAPKYGVRSKETARPYS
jgi:hypothetical protein